MDNRVALTRQRLRTPRAAAVAGILFAVLFTFSVTLMRLALSEDLGGVSTAASLQANAGKVNLALTFLPFAGIAFLWFMGVIRDRLGKYEDQFFSTVFFGSGLLFLAMVFSAAAVAGGILSSLSRTSGTPFQSDVITFGRAVMYSIMNVYAIRMAGVFMFSLGTIWVRTRVMPRPLIILTFGLALIMLVAINLSAWLILALPAWVLIISVYILVVSLRGDAREAEELIGTGEA